MRTSLDPRGILLAHTLPALLLFLLMVPLFGHVKPALNEDGLFMWRAFALWLGLGTLIATGYAAWCILRHKPVHFLYGVLVFLLYVPLLWLSLDQQHVLFPWDVQPWMVPIDARLYGIRILSVTLLHALFVLVGASFRHGGTGKPVRDLGLAVAIPLVVYVGYQLLGRRSGPDRISYELWVLFLVMLVILFLFLLFRALVAVVRGRSTDSPVAKVLRVIVALILPLLGLAVNQGLFNDFSGLLGDLSNPAWFAIALLNGGVVVWGSSTDPKLRMLQFILRCIGFTYVLYFFVIFLPFLPLSIVAIIGFGLGFLLLAPVLLFLVQGMQLLNDFRFLRRQRSVPALIGIGLAGLLVLPIAITGRYLYDRQVLHRALQAVYTPGDGDDPSRINATALGRVLDQVEDNKAGRSEWDPKHIPFLTPWYNRVVLDNLTLSDVKIDQLRRIFIGRTERTRPVRRAGSAQADGNITLDSLSTRSTYDPTLQQWRTWVDLEMTNHGGGWGEFATVFRLPPGAYISDEYLVIDGEQVHGILAERKAALWIYQQIRDYRRDPSITTYAGPDRISLKVFPFKPNETRYAGFEVLHKEPLPLHLDGFDVALGDPDGSRSIAEQRSGDGHTVYLPTLIKAGLPMVELPVHMHLIVDGSIAAPELRADLIAQIDRLLEARQLRTEDVTMHISDVRTRSMPWGPEAKEQYQRHVPRGGFFSDRPIRNLLTEACLQAGKERPLVVVVPDPRQVPPDPGVLMDGLAELAVCQGGSDRFLLLEADGSLTERPFNHPDQVVRRDVSIPSRVVVHAWPDARSPSAYFAVDGLPGVALLKAGADEEAPTLQVRNWSDALSLEGRWRNLALDPGLGTAGWLSVVRGSFEAQVLAPQTAWICLESELQRNTLMQKQEQTLKARSTMDAGEEELVGMSEPGLGWLITGLLVLLGLHHGAGRLRRLRETG